MLEAAIHLKWHMNNNKLKAKIKKKSKYILMNLIGIYIQSILAINQKRILEYLWDLSLKILKIKLRLFV
jgi:hypothetical protein